MQALYPTFKHTVSEVFDYTSYIYLLAPVSLAIINPVGFVFMEFQKQISSNQMKWKQVRCRVIDSSSLVLHFCRLVVIN